MGPGGIRLPKFAERVLALSKAAATDRATADEALNKTGIGTKFAAGELSAEEFYSPAADIDVLTAPVAELGAVTADSITMAGPITPITFPMVQVLASSTIDFTHNLGYVPWLFMVQHSTDGGAIWSPTVSGVGLHTITLTTTYIRLSNANTTPRHVRCAVLG